MGSSFSRASATSTGCSSRQATHHEAHTLSSHTLPAMSFGLKEMEGLTEKPTPKASPSSSSTSS